MQWIPEPPSEWYIGEIIKIRFRISAVSEFYGQAQALNVFSRIPLVSSSNDASSFCSAGVCKIFQVENTCCIWHMSVFMNKLPSQSEEFSSEVCKFDHFNNVTTPVYSGSSLNSEWNVLVPNVTIPGIYLLFVRILVGRFQGSLVKKVTITDSNPYIESTAVTALQITEIILIVLACILLIALASGMLYFYKKKLKQNEIVEETWQIDPDTICDIDPEDQWFKLFLSRSTTCSLAMILLTLISLSSVTLSAYNEGS
ncbi:unnamed protein product [Heterobilharzia americana]|nr:unnamed protein product [Heterobilharzia americana]